MVYSYLHTLPNVPLDIIGDVHGEFAALQALLRQLGYAEDGSHSKGRCLVFVGDLCDRGPDSPAVLAWFRAAQQAGFAYMVLGNHELNVLVNDPKDGSGWFFPQREAKDALLYAPWQHLPEEEKTSLKAWLVQQPLMLQRSDIRIVHAAWLPEAMPKLEKCNELGLVAAYRYFDEQMQQSIQGAPWFADYQREQTQYAEALENADKMPPFLPAHSQYDWQRGQNHPIRAVSSGVERKIDTPFFAGGRWRFTARCAWWQDYQDNVPVVIGHYWRNWQARHVPSHRENLMPSEGNAWHGARGNVFCVDFSVGARWRDRKQNISPAQSQFRLAALRWPERVLVFDDGEEVNTQGFEAV